MAPRSRSNACAGTSLIAAEMTNRRRSGELPAGRCLAAFDELRQQTILYCVSFEECEVAIRLRKRGDLPMVKPRVDQALDGVLDRMAICASAVREFALVN